MVLAIKSKSIKFLLKALVILLSAVLMSAAFWMAFWVTQCAQNFRSADSLIESLFEEKRELADYLPLSEKLSSDMYSLYEMTENTLRNETEDEYTDYFFPEDLKYYVVNHKNGEERSNFSAEELAALKDGTLQTSIAVTNGVPAYSTFFNNVLERYLDRETGKLLLPGTEQCDYVLVINPSVGSYDSYSYSAVLYKYQWLAAYPAKTDFIAGLVLGTAALLLAAVVFVIAGEKEKSGKTKRMWLDYIPTDLHLVLTVAAQIGVSLLLGYMLDTFYYRQQYDSQVLSGLIVAACAGIVWLLVLEFVTSFIRVCKSDKKLWNNLLAVMTVKALIIKPVKVVIAALKYQPNCFKKKMKIYWLLYGATNLLLLVIAFVAAITATRELQFFVVLLMIVGNLVCLLLLLQYAEKLDKIITAAHFRAVPQVDYYQLPNSLKTLCSSLQYTRQELDAAVSRAVKDERMRTELITNVSHDLKTPLTSIISYIDLLKQCDVQNDNAKEYIAVLDEKSIRLKRLIDDLMEASKISSGVIALNPVMLSLNELAAQAIGERQQEFAKSDLELVFKGDKAPVTCYADGAKTFRVLDNLLSNARKYSAKGTRVYCEVYETAQYSVFEIKNISAQPLDMTPQELTERFVRGDRSRNTEGSGLGLSIAENLCRAQHGNLQLMIDGDLFKAQVLLPKKP